MRKSPLLAWALWDCGATGLNALVITFVFPVYLTASVGAGGDTSPTSWLGRAMTVAGIIVALCAPMTGSWITDPRRRRHVLTALTVTVVVLTATMSLIRDNPRYLLPGLVLLAATAACGDLASVPYNATLRLISTPETSGRISGFGLASGYVGSVALLLAVYVGFIAGGGSTAGALGISTADGLNVRMAMLLTAAWFLFFALPLLIWAPKPPAMPGRPAAMGAARQLWADLVAEWRRDRNVVYYLLASAVFRDGLSGVFAFGAVLGVNVYRISAANVLLFGVMACTVAAVGAVLGGLLDQRIGSKAVILGSLGSMIAVGLTLLTLSGPLAFWVCGLLLCLFIGPTQSSARALLLQMTADGKEGLAFGLYTTTGRAAAFLAPSMFFAFIDLFGADRAGLGGLLVVLTAGLLAMLPIRARRAESVAV
ncbi:MFS transporter [Mycobacterium branderi]|uniref:MFS transporter n=1 Tax=Mycobacterium branderi TaxID=43348 RepID=A0ABN6BAQ8_9MYCO|nr:MFS transporter [Mycobacterium branderi]BBZ13943.1 MFS transporter [Mycobacterium branderi]